MKSFSFACRNLYIDTKTAVVTYAAIMQDQIYHTFYQQQ